MPYMHRVAPPSAACDHESDQRKNAETKKGLVLARYLYGALTRYNPGNGEPALVHNKPTQSGFS